MAVQKQGATKSVEEEPELGLDCFVIRSMGLREPLIELFEADRSPPEVSVLRSSCRNDTEASAGSSANPAAADTIDYRRIDLIFCAVAIDRRTRGSSNDSTAAALQCPPDQAVDQRVFKRRQRGFSTGRKSDQPIGILTSGMRHGEQDRQVPARFVNGWGGELAHGSG